MKLIYFAHADTQQKLLAMPESGMGYQLIHARSSRGYRQKPYLIYNSNRVISLEEVRGIRASERRNIQEIILFSKDSALEQDLDTIDLSEIKLISEVQRNRQIIREFSGSHHSSHEHQGAKDSQSQNANGIDQFIRLSAYKDDKRVDREHKRLLLGSYATTLEDYDELIKNKLDPIERYALPNDIEIQWVFLIQPKNTDTYKQGVVQPNNNKRGGGGVEAYFENGTSPNTLKEEWPYK